MINTTNSTILSKAKVRITATTTEEMVTLDLRIAATTTEAMVTLDLARPPLWLLTIDLAGHGKSRSSNCPREGPKLHYPSEASITYL